MTIAQRRAVYLELAELCWASSEFAGQLLTARMRKTYDHGMWCWLFLFVGMVK